MCGTEAELPQPMWKRWDLTCGIATASRCLERSGLQKNAGGPECQSEVKPHDQNVATLAVCRKRPTIRRRHVATVQALLTEVLGLERVEKR